MMTYELALEMVERALQDGETFNLAIAFTETTDGQLVKEIVAEQYHAAANSVGDFELTVEQYLYDSLEESENLKDADAFENAVDAEKDGFFWDDTLGKWLKLNFAF